MASFEGDYIDNSITPTCVVAFSCVCCSKCGVDIGVLLECWGMWGIFCSSICLCSEVLVWVRLLVLPILICIWFWLVRFRVMDFSCSTFVMFHDSSGFPFCLVWSLVQCLFISLWIVLGWRLYEVVSLIFCGEGWL